MEYMGNSYFALKNQVIKAERRILKVSERIFQPIPKGNTEYI